MAERAFAMALNAVTSSSTSSSSDPSSFFWCGTDILWLKSPFEYCFAAADISLSGFVI